MTLELTPADFLDAGGEALRKIQDYINGLAPGGAGQPLPFVGSAPANGWTRPSLATFSSGINLSGVAAGVGTDSPPANGVPTAGGSGYATNDTVTLTGGTLKVGASDTIITVDTVDGSGAILTCHISTAGVYTAEPANPVHQGSTSGGGSGATFDIGYGTTTLTDNVGGLPLVMSGNNYIFNSQGNAAYPVIALKSIGAPPWTITVGLAALSNVNVDSVQPYWIPIFLYDSAADKGIGLRWTHPTGHESQVDIIHYTGTDPNTSAIGSVISTTKFSFQDYFEWFRIENDGTNLTYSISNEGILFMPFWQEAVGAFTGPFDKAGFGLDASDFAEGNFGTIMFPQEASALWQWTD